MRDIAAVVSRDEPDKHVLSVVHYATTLVALGMPWMRCGVSGDVCRLPGCLGVV